jgi:hypothetical protein
MSGFLAFLLQPAVFFCAISALLAVSLALGLKARRAEARRDAEQQRLEAQVASLQKELEFAAQMNEGLKGQYDEIEERLTRLSEQQSTG